MASRSTKSAKRRLPRTLAEIAPSPMRKEDEERERRYRAQQDLQTLTAAEEIRRDRERLAAAKRIADSQAKVVAKR